MNQTIRWGSVFRAGRRPDPRRRRKRTRGSKRESNRWQAGKYHLRISKIRLWIMGAKSTIQTKKMADRSPRARKLRRPKEALRKRRGEERTGRGTRRMGTMKWMKTTLMARAL